MRRVHVLSCSILVLAAGLLAAAASMPQEAPPPTIKKLDPSRQQPPPPLRGSLFDRLGGTYAVAAVIDDYLNGLAQDPIIMANPQIKAACERAHAANGIPGLKFQITAWVIEHTGGPYKFHGQDMKESHADLMITEGEWAANAAILKTTVDKFKVPANEQAELMAIIQKTHEDIVTVRAPSGH